MRMNHWATALGGAIACVACAGSQAVEQQVVEPQPEIAVVTQQSSALNNAREVVRRQIEEATVRRKENGGDRREGAPIYGALDDDSTATHEFAVAEAGPKSFYMACDADCNDIDIRVMDARGGVVSDTLGIQEEFVGFNARTAESYRVQVTMRSCYANPCVYGLQLFRR
jgi:hypothetical protein